MSGGAAAGRVDRADVERGGADARTPVHLLTGFLGSGKTTLLRRLLSDPRFADTAVVINEFGEVGLDQLLVREVAEDVVLLDSGCLCCSVRDDLVSTLAELDARSRRGDIPRYARAIVETTGLADPAPILQALMAAKEIAPTHRLGCVVTTVDALNGARTLDAHREARRQLAMADRVVITKADLVAPDASRALAAELERRNPEAEIAVATHPRFDLGALFAMPDPALRAVPPAAGAVDEDAHLGSVDVWPPHEHAGARADEPRHDGSIGTFTVEPGRAVPWDAFVDWLELLLVARGDSVLRVKGLLAVEGERRPLVLQGVQHVLYPPAFLPEWPAGSPPGGWIVFIARDLTREAIERSLRQLLPNSPAPRPSPSV
ncbi:MAG TPA: GTP-binding protein [Caldimonas sp.]|nr:GTP-binding protein [Caldimonas sp.]